MRNVRVFEPTFAGILPGIGARAGLSKAAEARIVRRVKAELRSVLNEVIEDAFEDRDGFNKLTGNSFNVMRRGGVRVFGTSFNTLRAHIIGPSYIRKQEEGGTIRPRRAKALAIPLPAALRPDGTPKLAGPRNWQGVKNTFIYKSKKNGRAYIAYKNSNGGLTLLYSLVPEVKIQAKKALQNAWNQNSEAVIRAFGAALLTEFSRVDLLSLARVTTKGRGRRS